MNLDLNAMNLFGDNISLKQVFLDTIRPVGSVYVQYPQQDSPQDLFNGDGVASTWQEINYDGAFFRASGGNAASYIDKTKVLVKQSDQNKSHTHEMQNHTHGMWHMHYMQHTHTVNVPYDFYQFDDDGHSNFCPRSSTDRTTSNASRDWTDGPANSSGGGRNDTDGPSNNTTTDGTNCGTECRPSNYTIKVWKRTA